MRDSRDAKVRFLWDRMVVSTRPDPSDAGIAWFLATGDEECDPAKLKRLLDEHQLSPPTLARRQVRAEAENFRHLEGFVVEDRKDKRASHQLNIFGKASAGCIRTRVDEPFMPGAGRYDVVVHHRETPAQRCRYTFFINGVPRGAVWDSAFGDDGWTNQIIRDVEFRIGDEIRVDVEGASSRLDYVQFNLRR
jgi:hypothetical protein